METIKKAKFLLFCQRKNVKMFSISEKDNVLPALLDPNTTKCQKNVIGALLRSSSMRTWIITLTPHVLHVLKEPSEDMKTNVFHVKREGFTQLLNSTISA